MAESPMLPEEEGSGPESLLAALRERGAHRFDPVRFRFIEALARRAAAQQGEVRRLLDARLARAAAELRERFENAGQEAGELLDSLKGCNPEAAPDLESFYAAGDFAALRRAAATPGGESFSGPLAELVALLARSGSESLGEVPVIDSPAIEGGRRELKSVAYFRDTWSKLSLDQQLAQALSQGPENAGPLNAHFLVLETLKLLRDLSPDYLARFLSYADALLFLDQGKAGGPLAARSLRS